MNHDADRGGDPPRPRDYHVDVCDPRRLAQFPYTPAVGKHRTPPVWAQATAARWTSVGGAAGSTSTPRPTAASRLRSTIRSIVRPANPSAADAARWSPPASSAARPSAASTSTDVAWSSRSRRAGSSRRRTRPTSDGIVGIGGDLEPGTLLAAYRSGLFPMPFGRRRIAWFSPDPRAIIPLDGLRVSRSLRRSARRFEVRRDTRVRRGDGALRRSTAAPGGWITPSLRRAPTPRCTSSAGRTRSSRCDDDGELVGGLYGVRIGGFFAGESMFHTRDRRLEGGARRRSSTGCARPAPRCSTCSG